MCDPHPISTALCFDPLWCGTHRLYGFLFNDILLFGKPTGDDHYKHVRQIKLKSVKDHSDSGARQNCFTVSPTRGACQPLSDLPWVAVGYWTRGWHAQAVALVHGHGRGQTQLGWGIIPVLRCDKFCCALAPCLCSCFVFCVLFCFVLFCFVFSASVPSWTRTNRCPCAVDVCGQDACQTSAAPRHEPPFRFPGRPRVPDPCPHHELLHGGIRAVCPRARSPGHQ